MSFNSTAANILPIGTVSNLDINDYNPNILATAAVAAALTVLQYLNARKRDVNVPSVGPSGRISSYFGALKYFTNSRAMLEEGYHKYKTKTFKVPELARWTIVVNTPELIDEVRRAPETVLSFNAATNEDMSMEYTLGPAMAMNHYHTGVVRSQLTRNIGALFGNVKEEIDLAFDEYIGHPDDWISKPVLDTMMKVVCRASNRLFIGLPLCRDPDYMDLNIRFTVYVNQASNLMKRFPRFMRGLVGKFMTRVPESMRRADKHLRPIIEERLRQFDEYGKDWSDKPNDLLTWLIEDAPEDLRNLSDLTQRILGMNFAAIHTSSMSFSQALFQLATHPECIGPMREEAERVINAEGWSKASMQKLFRIDSFLRESQRYYGISYLSMSRLVLQDYTLSDGTFLPKGSYVACNATSVHRNDSNYSDANEFKAFRFSELREKSAEESVKNQMVSTSNEYLTFGHGMHACPGRFFAANELKAMMAYVVLNYDVKLPPEANGIRPQNLEIGPVVIPNQTAHVLFKKRKD